MFQTLIKTEIDKIIEILEEEQNLTVEIEDYIEKNRYVIAVKSEEINYYFSLVWTNQDKVFISTSTDFELPIELNPPGLILTSLPFCANTGTRLLDIAMLDEDIGNDVVYRLRVEIGYELAASLFSSVVVEEILYRLVHLEGDYRKYILEEIKHAELSRNDSEENEEPDTSSGDLRGDFQDSGTNDTESRTD